MTYGELFSCRTFVQKLRQLSLTDGEQLLKLNELTKCYDEAIAPYNETYNSLVKRFGKDGTIGPADKGWSRFVEEATNAGAIEVEWEARPLWELTILIAMMEGLSADELDIARLLGVLKEDAG